MCVCVVCGVWCVVCVCVCVCVCVTFGGLHQNCYSATKLTKALALSRGLSVTDFDDMHSNLNKGKSPKQHLCSHQ